MEIDTGDHVLHGPTGETWVVARVLEDKLAWCGWPQGWANLADCTLVKKACPESRLRLLREIAGSSGHHCAEWAAEAYRRGVADGQKINAAVAAMFEGESHA